ncbi:MAG: hypothetical protein MnENMB40S_24300 [Rhizobiaceae bacterium MnEN-MB40S]|nr:MAG: hypothetical protein MnENMB40S_24300 [Rhizobiaceae bacterium MnEN-MB40S]
MSVIQVLTHGQCDAAQFNGCGIVPPWVLNNAVTAFAQFYAVAMTHGGDRGCDRLRASTGTTASSGAGSCSRAGSGSSAANADADAYPGACITGANTCAYARANTRRAYACGCANSGARITHAYPNASANACTRRTDARANAGAGSNATHADACAYTGANLSERGSGHSTQCDDCDCGQHAFDVFSTSNHAFLLPVSYQSQIFI